MIRLIVLDVEGVLVLPGGGQLPWPLESLLEVRRFLQRSPAACILCTGRQSPYGEAMIQALDLLRPLPGALRERVREGSGCDLLAWPSIVENGAYFYDPMAKRPIPHPALTPERTALLLRLRGEVIAPFVAATGAQLEAGKDFTLSLNPPLVSQTGSERVPIAGFAAAVRRVLQDYEDVVEVKHSQSAVDITPRGVSKASAVRLLLDWTGLPPEEVLGVGDTAADAEWLREVGWSAAPENGRDALPGLHYYAPRSVTEGLLDVLRRLEAEEYRSV